MFVQLRSNRKTKTKQNKQKKTNKQTKKKKKNQGHKMEVNGNLLWIWNSQITGFGYFYIIALSLNKMPCSMTYLESKSVNLDNLIHLN